MSGKIFIATPYRYGSGRTALMCLGINPVHSCSRLEYGLEYLLEEFKGRFAIAQVGGMVIVLQGVSIS
jgi:hypothetical protein